MTNVCPLGCDVCAMSGENLPRDWRTGVPEPVVRLVHDVYGEILDEDGRALFEQDGPPQVIVSVQVPVFASILHDQVGSLAVSERWPTLEGKLRATLTQPESPGAAEPPASLGEPSKSHTDPLRCLVFGVYLPVYLPLREDPPVVLSMIEEALVYNIRAYQLARRVGFWSGG